MEGVVVKVIRDNFLERVVQRESGYVLYLRDDHHVTICVFDENPYGTFDPAVVPLVDLLFSVAFLLNLKVFLDRVVVVMMDSALVEVFSEHTVVFAVAAMHRSVLKP